MPSLRILHFSDIHLDLFYDSYSDPNTYQCKKVLKHKDHSIEYDTNVYLDPKDYGKYGCDTNLNLYHALIDKAKKAHDEKPFDKIIIIGDSVNHKLNQDTVNITDNYNKLFKYIKNTLSVSFPNTDILFSMGNNDLEERYNFPKDIEMYNFQMKRIKESLIKVDNPSNIFKEASAVINKNLTPYI